MASACVSDEEEEEEGASCAGALVVVEMWLLVGSVGAVGDVVGGVRGSVLTVVKEVMASAGG